ITDAWPTFPALSYAFTASVCEPALTLAVFQANEKGEAVVEVLSCPSTQNSIRVTPTLSVAVPVTVIVPETVAEEAGLEIDTVGACVSPATGYPLDSPDPNLLCRLLWGFGTAN